VAHSSRLLRQMGLFHPAALTCPMAPRTGSLMLSVWESVSPARPPCRNEVLSNSLNLNSCDHFPRTLLLKFIDIQQISFGHVKIAGSLRPFVPPVVSLPTHPQTATITRFPCHSHKNRYPNPFACHTYKQPGVRRPSNRHWTDFTRAHKSFRICTYIKTEMAYSGRSTESAGLNVFAKASNMNFPLRYGFSL